MARTVLYVGCYTNDAQVGVRVFDASDPAGRLVTLSEFEGAPHMSFLAAHPGGRLLYAVSETEASAGKPEGDLLALRVNESDGTLTVCDRASSYGAGPCHVSVAPAGHLVYVANYVSGSVTAYAIDGDGRFGELVGSWQHVGSGPSTRQEGPHAHCVAPSPDGSSLYAVDLGTDQVIRYERTGRGNLPIEEREGLPLEPGSGPRHLTFHPTQPVAFVVCELSSTLVMLGHERRTGRLRVLSSQSTLPAGQVVDSLAAGVSVHPRGHCIYVSNRGHDSIAVSGFAGPSRPLEPLGHVPSGGRTPRHLATHPTGQSLVVTNQGSDQVVTFEVEQHTGVPRELSCTEPASEPACAVFLELQP